MKPVKTLKLLVLLALTVLLSSCNFFGFEGEELQFEDVPSYNLESPLPDESLLAEDDDFYGEEDVPIEPPCPSETFSPRANPETDPENFPRFAFANDIKESGLRQVHFGLPEDYANVQGVTTFRGNNFRNAPAFGELQNAPERLEIIYQVNVGRIERWTGVGWTGQPAIIRWDDDIRRMMNIHPHLRERDGLVEVIQGALDGYIYFFELETGEETRPRIHLGDPIKGGVTLDPRGYPLLYVGQGDNINLGRFGFYIFSLLDGSELHFINGRDSFAARGWGAFDSNPLFDINQDVMILAGENGIIYNINLNTNFERDVGIISIAPEISRYRHTGSRRLGTENSPAAFANYLFFSDNAGWIQCLNLHTLEPVWVFDARDDTDSTIVLDWDEEREGLFLYTATQADLPGPGVNNSYIRKLDAATGEELWAREFPCRFHETANGGVTSTPVVGKGNISHLVIHSIARVVGRESVGMVIAFDKETGDEVWAFPMTEYGWFSPTAIYSADGKSRIVVADANGTMFLLDGATGEEIYRINVGANIEASPAVFDDMLIVGTRGQRVVGVRLG